MSYAHFLGGRPQLTPASAFLPDYLLSRPGEPSTLNTILVSMAPADPFLGTVATILNACTPHTWDPLISFRRNGTICQLEKIQDPIWMPNTIRKIIWQNIHTIWLSPGRLSRGNSGDKRWKFWVRLGLFAAWCVALVHQKWRHIWLVSDGPKNLTNFKRFAESYMLGEITSPDLTKFFEANYCPLTRIRIHLEPGVFIQCLDPHVGSINGLAGLFRNNNNLKNARLNITAHYDISNDMFSLQIWQCTLPRRMMCGRLKPTSIQVRYFRS
jgi:cyclopropane-fatty-acyl-phospholipid synthase